MRIVAKWLIVTILISVSCSVYGQYLSITDRTSITNLPGDEINAEWSSDSKNLLFQCVEDGKSRIYIYWLDNDTLTNLNSLDNSFKNPVWHPDGDKIVFDSDMKGSDYLYSLDLKTMEVKPLFLRDIVCRNASFSVSARQVYFTGWDELTSHWEIYSYDFIYDNLNRLTDNRLGSGDPDVCDDGKQIVYCKINPFNGTKNIEVINWYGEHVIKFDEFNGKDPSWGPSGLKLFFISDMDNEKEELYSIWKDGSHLERLTNDEIQIECPIVSPDGTKIAVSVLTESGWDIFVLSLEDY